MTTNDSWLSSIYSDGSIRFVTNPTPKKCEKISIFLQYSSDSPVKSVLLQGKFNGVGHPRPMKKVEEKNGLVRCSIDVQIFEDEFKYFFCIATSSCIYYYTQHGITTYIPDEAYLFRILTDYEQCEWVKNAVFYQIFPDRFFNGNEKNDVKDGEYFFDGFPSTHVKDWEKEPEPYEKAHCLDFYGGDLEGIREKIPYLKKLGITALYLNPIFWAATVHRYDCLDYFKVDPHLGGDKALSDLTEALHKNGMRIILDVSINHTGIANRWFNRDGTFFPKTEGAFNNPESKERSFYFFGDNNSYKAWFNVETLPTLNYTSSELRKRIYGSEDSLVKKWLKNPFSIDGWRFDVADTMARNDLIQLHHEIWPEIRKSIKAEKKDAYILAEDWSECSEFLNGNEWDSPMNYFASTRPIRQFYGQDDIFNGRADELRGIKYKMTAKNFVGQVKGYLSRLPFVIQQNQFNLIDSHDVPRFHNDSSISKDSVKGANILIFTLPGCTNIYYGDEADIDGTVEEIEGCRYPMPWSKDIENLDTFRFLQKLIKIKTESPAFKDGGFKFVYAEGYIFAFARFTAEEVYFTVISGESEEKTINIPLNCFGESFSNGIAPEKDALGEKLCATIESGNLVLKVPAGKAYLVKMQ